MKPLFHMNRRDFLISTASVMAALFGLRRRTETGRNERTSSGLIQLRDAAVVPWGGRAIAVSAVLPSGWRYEYSLNGCPLDGGWTTEEGFAPPAKTADGRPLSLIVDCAKSSVPFFPGANTLRVTGQSGEAGSAPNDCAVLEAEIRIHGLLLYEETLPGAAWHEERHPLRYRSCAPDNTLVHLIVIYEDGWRRALALQESTSTEDIHEIVIPDADRVISLEVVAHGIEESGPLFMILATRMGEHRVLPSYRYDRLRGGRSA